MCHFKSRESESLENFMSRTNKFINDLLAPENLGTWDVLLRREVFKWAGWVARLQTFDYARTTLHIMRFKDRNWLNLIASQNRGGQLHGRFFKVWRWELLIYSYFEENFPGTPWQDVAQDALEWDQIVQNIL